MPVPAKRLIRLQKNKKITLTRDIDGLRLSFGQRTVVFVPFMIPPDNVYTNTPGTNQMNVMIDRMACVSCGACWNTSPELFDQNPCDSFSQIVEQYRFNGDRAVGIVPDCLLCCTEEASDLCPEHIIHIA